MNFENDISISTAVAAYNGTSWTPERRGESTRREYADTLAGDYAMLKAQAEKGKTLDMLEEEFSRYRAGYRRRTMAYLHSSARCVSSFIAGPSKFPAGRMNKRADIAHRRLNDLVDFRARALAAIRRNLRPDLAPIYSSDSDALERLEVKIAHAEAVQARMKTANAAIRKHAKAGRAAQIQALLELGYPLGAASRLLEPDFCGRIGFPNYELTNNSANIRRMKERVEIIGRLQATPAEEIEGENGIRFEDAPQDNRVRLYFPGKPAHEIRQGLKARGFRWAPTIAAWQAYRNASSVAYAKTFIASTAPAEPVR